MEPPPKTQGALACSARLDVPDMALFVKCQRMEGHTGDHFYAHALNGVKGHIEVRWS